MDNRIKGLLIFCSTFLIALILIIFFGDDISVGFESDFGGFTIDQSSSKDALDTHQENTEKILESQVCEPGNILIGRDEFNNIICGEVLSGSTFEETIILPNIPFNKTNSAMKLEEFIHEGYVFSNNMITHNGLELIKVGKFDEAVSLYGIGLKVEPDNKIFHNNLGVALKGLQNYSGAMHHFDQSLIIDPNYSFGKINKGTIYDIMGDEDKAINLYNEVLDDDEYNVNSLFNKAVIFVEREDFEQALELTNKILFVEQNHWDALYANVASNIKLGNFDEAQRTLEQRFDEVPENSKTKKKLSEAQEFLDMR